ncbi:MAG: multiubiquitin domain-containing protein [Sulfuricaulis sp.]
MNSNQEGQGNDKSYAIVVNGTQETWTDHRITYEQVVQLAFPGSPLDVLYTVSYANPHGKDGTLAPGQDTQVKDGVVFNVVKTNRS